MTLSRATILFSIETDNCTSLVYIYHPPHNCKISHIISLSLLSFMAIRLSATFLLFCSVISISFSDSSQETSPCSARRFLRGTTGNNTIQQFLIPHDVVRTELGLPSLKWSKKLASFASGWANKRRGDCNLVHSKSDYGENLFWGSGKDWKAGDAVEAWAAERSFYNHETNTCAESKDCLHYTQVIWRQSLKVGWAAHELCVKVAIRLSHVTMIPKAMWSAKSPSNVRKIKLLISSLLLLYICIFIHTKKCGVCYFFPCCNDNG